MSSGGSGEAAVAGLEADPAAVMSVILAAARGTAGIRRALASLSQQSASHRLELVLVTDADDSDEDGLDPRARARFAKYRVVRLPELRSKAEANAEGVRHATAPVVAFAEDHCFSDPGWAEALIRRHATGCAAVAPRIRNANPATSLSWCDLLVNYGPFLAASSGGPQATLPGHNCSYKKEVFELCDGRLADWLEVEDALHGVMAERGLALHLEADAVVAHVNVSRWRSWIPCRLYEGRIYAAGRCRGWSVWRRGGYALAWPAIALLRWGRLLMDWPAEVDGLPSRKRLAGTLLVGLVLDAMGQAVGYAAGAGAASARMRRFDFGRAAHVLPEERSLLEATA